MTLLGTPTLTRDPKKTNRGSRLSWLDKGVIAAAVLILALAAIGPVMAPEDIYRSDIAKALLPPDGTHLLGTDDQGRDVLWRIVAGTQVTVFSAILVVASFSLIAIIVALAASLGPKWIDEVLMRTTDVALAVPAMVLGLGIAAALGPSLQSAVIAMIISGWPMSARLLRSVIRQTMTLPYVEGAKALGVSTPRLMLRHVLPNSIDVLLVKWAGDIGQTILVIAGLSFIGLGAQAPSAEWGAMVAGAKGYVATAWWAAIYPGIAIAITAAVFGLLGDTLQAKISNEGTKA
ncbi:ABC transporter permease [Paenarthrobacter nicotinovorans]|uniref:ABC transporter permease n=1 Tax=Paenarthrobacter nicotinovorans TaxID=29320 RepID=UPI003749ACC1